MPSLVNKYLQQPLASNTVYIVGAGVGDCGMLTLQALRCLQQAQIVLHDNLVNPEILNFINPQAGLVKVGKICGKNTITQAQINQYLINSIKKYQYVVRLKGGDSSIFARSGEEIAVLAEHNINFQLVPGITSAAAAASYAGISLTHRDYASQVLFLSGHSKNGKLEINWDAITPSGQTLVFYMPLAVVDKICTQLQHIGLDASTPAAIMEKISYPEQRVLASDIQNLPGMLKAQEQKFISPSLLIVGQVLSLSSYFTNHSNTHL